MLMVISLTEEDGCLLERFRDALKSDCDIRTCKPNTGYGEKNGKPYVVLSSYNKPLALSLIKQGCIPAKSKTIEMPLEVPNHLMHHFVRGYSDGDGSICLPKNINNLSDLNKAVWSITSSTIFCTQLKAYIHNVLNLNSYLYEYKNGNQYTSDLTFKGRPVLIKALNWLYKDATIYLDRKFDKYNQFITFNENILNTKSA